MKTGKSIYLITIIIIFIILRIPFFENVGNTSDIRFFTTTQSFVSLYPWLLFLGLVEGALITLYINSWLSAIKKEEPTKFNL